MNYAKQPDYLPTNKAAVAASVASIVSPAMLILSYHYGDSVLPPEILEAYGALLMGAISVISGVILAVAPRIGVAWYVPDRANVPEDRA